MKILNGVDLPQIDEKGLKTLKKHQIIKPKAFKEYVKSLGCKPEDYIVRSTMLGKIKYEDLEDYDEALMLQVVSDSKDEEEEYRYYKLYKPEDETPPFCTLKGYVAVSETEFVQVYRNIFLILLFWFLGLLGLLIALILLGKPVQPDIDNPIKLDDSQTTWNGELPNVDGEVEQENIEIPGFYKFTASEGAGSVPLYNPSDNTVYFQYDIYEIVNSVEVASFDSASEAQKYVNEHNTEYSISKERGYSLVDEAGSTVSSVKSYKSVPNGSNFSVVEETIRVLYSTDMISPGNQILWNAYNVLSSGEYKLKFVINTFDIETGGKCYGAVQTVEAILN